MKRFFSRMCGAVFAASLMLAAIPAPTAAAAGIQVALDDRPLSFSDAQPLMRNNRTFVPFRAIFESMGASVSWDNASHTVTAKRGDRTIQLTIGRKSCSVSRSGADRSFVTDAAPFIEGGRTYVPVRFAAQALGAAVGWDNNTQTVVIVDTENMMQTAFNGQFENIDSIVKFANTCVPVMPRTVTGSLGATFTFHTAMGDLPASITGSLSGKENLEATEFSVNLQTDRSAIEAAIVANEGLSVMDENVDVLLQKMENITANGIISRADGKLYLKSDFLTEVGIQKGAWAMKPLKMGAGLTAVKNADATDFVCAAAQRETLSLGSSTSQVRTVLERLSDQSASLSGANTGSADLWYQEDYFTSVDLSLSSDQVLTVTRTATQDGNLISKMTLVHRTSGTSVTYEKNTPAYSAAVRIDLTPGAPSSAPAIRPA